jgi:hypothetical protein
MNEWTNLIFNSDYGAAFTGGTYTIVFIMFLAFALGHVVGYVYMWTHESISYSRTFVASLAMMPVIVGVMMVVMAGNILVAFGLLGVFGVIRFRNVLKDTRDTTFLLWSIMEGVTVGTMRFSTAVLAVLGISIVALYIRMVSFGTRNRYDAVVALRINGDLLSVGANLKQVLGCHTVRSTVVTERRVNDGGVDISYRLLLRDPARFDELQAALAQTEGLSNVSVFLHDDEAEI